MRLLNRYLFTTILIIKTIGIVGKECDCLLYDNALKALNKELNNSYKPYKVFFHIDSGYALFDTNGVKFDTVSYSKNNFNYYKYIVPDVIIGNKETNPYFKEIYYELTNDSLPRNVTCVTNSPVDLYKCKFKKSDSTFIINANDLNFETRDSIMQSYSYKIVQKKNSIDTFNYTPVLIYFSRITYLSNNMAFFYVQTSYGGRKFYRNILFKKEDNKWQLYKLGKMMHSQ